MSFLVVRKASSSSKGKAVSSKWFLRSAPAPVGYADPCNYSNPYCTVLYSYSTSSGHLMPLISLYRTVLYCTVLYCTVLYCTVLYCTVLYCTVLYCTVDTVLYCTVLYCTVLYCTVGTGR